MKKTEEVQPLYQIIYLNGPSSSGKSELVKALQNFLEQPFLHIGIDKMIGMMPAKFNNWQGGFAPLGFSWKEVKDTDGASMQELQIGSFAHKIYQTYKDIVLTLARSGYFIIIDDVSFGIKEFDQWKELLVDYQILYVGVHAPLNIIEERERDRGNRMVGSARA
jgi:chloramphenicol 3-O phosphotransferase